MLTLTFKSSEVGTNLPLNANAKVKELLSSRPVGTVIVRTYAIEPLEVSYSDGVKQTLSTLTSIQEFKVGDEAPITQRTKDGKFFIQLG